MSLVWETASFKTNVLIKNIIGKELINDDNVAVMELVKNSYDAGASKVEIEFKNIFNGDESSIQEIENISNKTSQIIIKDDGKGMSKDDILNKWLNIAYSSKKTEQTQNDRYQAGNKGVGRFSCDRLGEFLNIYTRIENQNIIHLQINWKDFELIDQINTQIQDIPINIRELNNTEFKEESGFNIFEKGTILQILKLNAVWAEIEDDTLFPKVNKSKLLKLKNSLERLINPNQSYDEKSFKIYLKAVDLFEDVSLLYHEKFNGQIVNQIFDKLDFKTTYIESFITEDGSKIVSELKDRNKTIFRLIEKNNEFPLLKNLKITLYYLNPYAKAYFKKQTGVRSVSFGSIFLFINGFRISPYGDTDNDWLGLEQRKGQGVRRNLGGREILGRIELKDLEGQYRVISSREGIVQNDAYKQLVSDFTKSKSSKYNGFYYKVHRRLEKYVVEGLGWDSSSIDEAEIEKLVEGVTWNEGQEEYVSDRQSKLNNSSEVIYSILGIKAKDVVDLYINEDLIESLIEENIEKTNEKLQTFLKNYSALSSDVIDEKTKNAITKLSKSIDDEELLKKFEEAIKEKRKIEEELQEQKKSQRELYKLFKKKVREDKEKATRQKQKLEEELKEVKKEKTFFQHLNTLDKQQILDLHHSIGTSSKTIDNYLNNIKSRLENNNARRPVDKEYLDDIIKKISFVNNKIATIANFATKAGFRADSEDMVNNLVIFISDYIDKVCMGEMKTLNHDELKINFTNNFSGEFILRFKPIEIAMLIDNLISNSRKAGANQIDIELINIDNNLELHMIDNGNGIKEDIKDKIFNLGFTTTEGSGMGLSHVNRILKALNGTINFDEKYVDGTKFVIRIKNEIKI